MSIISIELSDNLDTDLENLARTTGKTKSWLASQAIKRFIEDENWQTEKIKKSLDEADNQEFSSDTDAAVVLNKLGIYLNEN